MINTLGETRPKDAGSTVGKSREEIIQSKSRDLNKQLTYNYDIHQVRGEIRKLPGPRNYQDKGLQVPLNIFLF